MPRSKECALGIFDSESSMILTFLRARGSVPAVSLSNIPASACQCDFPMPIACAVGVQVIRALQRQASGADRKRRCIKDNESPVTQAHCLTTATQALEEGTTLQRQAFTVDRGVLESLGTLQMPFPTEAPTTNCKTKIKYTKQAPCFDLLESAIESSIFVLLERLEALLQASSRSRPLQEERKP